MKSFNKFINEHLAHNVTKSSAITEAQKTGRTIVFTTKEAMAVFACELSGQVSDGYWENTRPMNHWKWVTDTELILDTNADEGYYTGPWHQVKYSVEWLRRSVKKAMKGNGGDYAWTIRVAQFVKAASAFTNDEMSSIMNDGRKQYSWRYIAEEIPFDAKEITAADIEGSLKDYAKKYWEEVKDLFTDARLKKICKSRIGWDEVEDAIECAGESMNNHKIL